MATITTRSGKGSPLTNTEVDDNFTNLNTAKYESGDSPTFAHVYSGNVTVTSSGGQNFTQGDIVINSSTVDDPAYRGQGLFLFNEGADRTWYAGTLYNSAGDYGIGFADGTTLAKISSRWSNAVFHLYSGAGGAVFNENSADRDFRVESDSLTHMLFVDASANSIGVNNSSPSGVRLSVHGGAAASFAWGDTADRGFLSFDVSGNPIVRATTGLDLKFQVNAARDVLTLGASGTVFNEPGNDQDFRVESDTNTHMLFVDAGKNQVIFGANGGPAINAVSARTYDAVATNGISIGSTTYTHGYVGTAGTTGDVMIASNAYPANLGSSRSIRLSGGTSGGGFANMAVFNPENGAVWNEDSSSGQDFRVESDTDSHALFVDASTNNVGIGDSGPSHKLTVVSGGVNTARFYGSGGKGLYSYHDSEGTGWATGAGAGLWDNLIYLHETGDGIYLYTAGVNRLGVNPSEAVFNQPGNDVDFRVESDVNSYAFHVDGASSNIKINTSGRYNNATNKNLELSNTDIYMTNSTTPTTGYGPAIVMGDTSSEVGMTGCIVWSENMSSDPSTVSMGMYYDGDANRFSIVGSASGVYTTPQEHVQTAPKWFSIDRDSGLARVYESFVANENGGGADFRVESDGNTHMLFVDASGDTVGIGNSAPNSTYVCNIGQSNSTRYYALKIDSQGDTIFSHSRGGTSLMSFRNDSTSYVAIASNNSAKLMLGYGGTADAGAIANHLYFNVTETIVNDISENRDFRVESDANSHALFLDASDGFVKSGVAHYIGNTSNSLYSSGSGVGLYADNAYAGCGSHIEVGTDATYGWSSIYINRSWTTGEDDRVLQIAVNGNPIGYIRADTSGTSFQTTSDRRLKENIEAITDGTEKLMAMNPVTHTWKNVPEAPAVHGFIAQEMIRIVPEAVSGDPTGEEMMAMDYGRITPVLVAALQDAHKKIAALEARLNELEGK